MGGGLVSAVTVRRRPSANWGAIGDTVDGVFAEYVAVPFRNAYLIPDHVDDQQAALIEPLSCAVHGTSLLRPVVGRNVLIIGGRDDGPAAAAAAARAGGFQIWACAT
jgi:threonine dehydrogenase-like Zn-dependent dehydrogenase